MLTEFALIPSIFDEEAQPDVDLWREQLDRLLWNMFPNVSAWPVMVSNLHSGSWQQTARQMVSRIKDHRAKKRCQDLLQNASKTLVTRPACCDWPDDDLAWAREAVDSYAAEPIDRIVVTEVDHQILYRRCKSIRTLDEVRHAGFWRGIAADASPPMKISDQVALLRKLCVHSEFLCLVTPHIHGGGDDETDFAVELIRSALDRPRGFPSVEIEIHTESCSDDVVSSDPTKYESGVAQALDEAHHSPAPGYARLLRRLKKRNCKLLGLTATPVRGDEEDQRRLAALFDEAIVYQVNRQKLIDDNVLAVPSFETVKTRIEVEREFTAADLKHLERWGEFGPGVLERLGRHAPRNKLIVDQYLKNKDRYGPTIVFAADTLHCTMLAEEFRKAGVNADYVTYNRDDAQAVISRYQEKKQPDVLVNVEMLTEGFDAPHTRTVFIARPTRSEVLLTQMVGRALRGTKANGNEMAYLVTFLDTWNQFNVLDPEYVLADGQDSVPDGTEAVPTVRVSIPIDLVREAYRLISISHTAHLEGVFQCLPHGWFIWWETFEDDQQQRTVMIFENQREGFEAMLADFGDPGKIPDEVPEDYARDLIRRYFADVPDPLPRWADVKALLDAKRKACEVHRYTFDEKRRFDPKVLAQEVFEQEMSPQAKQRFLLGIWDQIPACGFVYRDNFHAFLEDVGREENLLLNPPPPPVEPEVEQLVPTAAPRAWGNGQPGYNLVTLRDAVLGVRQHFPNGTPKLGDLRWMDRVSKRNYGFCRYSDSCISINPTLNSPDVPRFVMEFLMYHELLHADMPYAGHNPDFRARERLFVPSAEAVDEALRSGIKPAATTGTWRARADGFLDTFQKRWVMGTPGSTMSL